jgi:hypothetical protein
VVDGKKDGEGIEYSHDQQGEGWLHHEYFINGKKHMGIKVIDLGKGEYIFKGQWNDNEVIEGQGEWWHINGDYYKGEWKNGKFNG